MKAGRVFIALAMMTLCAGGCAKKNYLNENDALRAKVIDLQRQIADLQQRSAELESQLHAAMASSDVAAESISEEVRLATPHPVSLPIDRLSHVRESEGDSQSGDRLLVYLKPADGRGRFVQLVGTLEITAFKLPMDADPQVVAKFNATPMQIRDAYRATLMSIHYTFEVPLSEAIPSAPPGSGDTVLVKARFTDAVTGKVLTAERSIGF